MLQNINWFDVLLIGILIVSAIFGFASGFTNKFFSILSWIGAALLTFYIYPLLRPWVGSFVSSDLAASIVTATAVFLVLFSTFKLSTSFLSQHVKNSPLKSLDRGLGVILGIITGLLFLAIINLSLLSFLTSAYPPSVKTSKIWPFIVLTTTYLEKMIPLKLPKAEVSNFTTPLSKEELVAKFSRAPSRPQKTNIYSSQDRQAMDKLLHKN